MLEIPEQQAAGILADLARADASDLYALAGYCRTRLPDVARGGWAVIAGQLVRFRGRRRSWLVLAIDGQTVTITTGQDTRRAPAHRLEVVPDLEQHSVPEVDQQPEQRRRTSRRVVVPAGTLPAGIAAASTAGDHEVVLVVAADALPGDVADALADIWPDIAHDLAGGDSLSLPADPQQPERTMRLPDDSYPRFSLHFTDRLDPCEVVRAVSQPGRVVVLVRHGLSEHDLEREISVAVTRHQRDAHSPGDA